MMKWKRTMLAFGCAALSLGVVLAPGSALAGVETLGTYQGNITEDQQGHLFEGFEDWVGRDHQYILDFYNPSDTNWNSFYNPEWLLDHWSATPYKDRLVISVPMMPNDPNITLAKGANGDYNTIYQHFAQKLVDEGYGNAIIRLGWEFNGYWFPYYALGKEADFAEFWREAVTSMRSVTNANFKFFWCPNIGESVNLDTAYPGDSYVDYIGFDYYDQSWANDTYPIPSGASESEKLRRWTNAWNFNKTKQYGLDYFTSKSATTGKPIVVGEWGVAIRDDGHGGGDNPYFIQWMHDWMKANNVAFHFYFDYNAGDGNHDLMHPNLTRAGAKFKELWGTNGETHTGKKSLHGQFESTATWTNAYQYVNGLTTNTTQTGSFWVKGSGKVSMKVFTSGWNVLTTKEVTATNTWTQHTFTFNNGGNANVIVTITDSGGVNGKLYVDDIFLGTGSTNKVTNGSFENGDDHWHDIDGTDFMIANKRGAAYDGVKTAKAVVSGSPTYSNLYQTVGGLNPSTAYEAGFWMRGSGKVSLKIFNSSWAQPPIADQSFTASSTWTYHRVTFTPGTSTIQFVITDAGNAPGTMYIDNAYLGSDPIGPANLLASPGFEGAGWSGVSGPFSIVPAH